ncbi:hypothetical protein C8J56DRAFT_1083689 [Mycena floridula]|nr:hypothetical protein C8J56DRAFT_1083689 [Mycena floridula]
MTRLSALSTTISQLDTFPDIPDDVIHLIFEAAVAAERSAALNLVLVARHVQKCGEAEVFSRIQPLQFKAVRLCNEQGAKSFLQEVTSSPTRLGIHLQTIDLSRHDLRPSLTKAIVDSLPHLSTLTDRLPAEDIRPFFKFSSKLPSLRRLSLSLNFQLVFTNGRLSLRKDVIPFLPESLTHLDLDGGYDYPLSPSDEALKRLTRLTHLIIWYDSVNNGDICNFVEKLLLHLPDSLQQIIITIALVDPNNPTFRGTENLCFSWIMKQCDPRVVFFMERPRTEVPRSIDHYNKTWSYHHIGECIIFDTLTLIEDWCISSPGYTDIWDRAAEMQEKVSRLRLDYREDSKAS